MTRTNPRKRAHFDLLDDEHGYLLDYKPADRPKYIEAFFTNIDWPAVEGRVQLKEALLPSFA